MAGADPGGRPADRAVANAASAILPIRTNLQGQAGNVAGPNFASGASIWATNVIAFALWYWEFDRGGPERRACATRQHPDLMFPQMVSPQLASPDWEPQFVDYLYLSFTNATAVSPTDVMPLARWAKLTMLVQAAISPAVAALVFARAVNILKYGPLADCISPLGCSFATPSQHLHLGDAWASNLSAQLWDAKGCLPNH